MRASLGVDESLKDGEGEAANPCSSADFSFWVDFPKGLRVLLIDHDAASAAATRKKLEEMDYVVSFFSSEGQALEAISDGKENFHVAIVEVNTTNNQESFTFLETARGLPTIMVSNGSCLSTLTMKCIALGAAEILQKPLSEEKIRNIWQHVVHKAFNAGESPVTKSLNPIRETVSAILQMQPDTRKGNERLDDTTVEQEDHGDRSISDGLQSPRTPQLQQGIRPLDAGDSCGLSSHSNADYELEMACKDTADFTFSCSDSQSADKTRCHDSNGSSIVIPPVKRSNLHHDLLHRRSKNIGKKKLKVGWTAELHKRFVQAVEQLGIDHAIPSKILALMKVEGLTRHNIASHLQKYRMQRKDAASKVDDRRWLHCRDPVSRGYTKRPFLSKPPPQSSLGYPRMHSAWGHPSFHPPGPPFWGSHGIWPWKSQFRMHADAWGCPVFSPQEHCPFLIPQNVSPNLMVPNPSHEVGNFHEHQLREELITEVVNEAISKPWLPLPIGLKPPSIDSVMVELQSQGISSIPPTPCHI